MVQGTNKVVEMGQEHVGQDKRWTAGDPLFLCPGEEGVQEGRKLGRQWGLCLPTQFRRWLSGEDCRHRDELRREETTMLNGWGRGPIREKLKELLSTLQMQ